MGSDGSRFKRQVLSLFGQTNKIAQSLILPACRSPLPGLLLQFGDLLPQALDLLLHGIPLVCAAVPLLGPGSNRTAQATGWRTHPVKKIGHGIGHSPERRGYHKGNHSHQGGGN